MENMNHKKKVIELEADIKKLSGQQNLQQRIHHHAKIKVGTFLPDLPDWRSTSKKCWLFFTTELIHHGSLSQEENNLLKNQNDDLIVKLRKTESMLSRNREELAHFRQINGRGPYIDFDKERMLENKLKVCMF